MSEFLSDEWLTELQEKGSQLPETGVSALCQYEISGTSQGKVRFYVQINHGRITNVAEGKHQDSDCVITTSAKVALQILSGERDSIEAFMQGDLKVEGNYQHYLLGLNSLRKSVPWNKMRRSLLGVTSS
ncbi:MAG: SCP2 sterol-binding domain-containing protein [Actinomycetota bacterium]|nr:SCP2 sterol-binding domain-containing protein [Actinomycetota bacterium]